MVKDATNSIGICPEETDQKPSIFNPKMFAARSEPNYHSRGKPETTPLTLWFRDSLGCERSPRVPGARTRRAASTTVHRREGWKARRETAGTQPYPAYCSSPRIRGA